LDPGNILLSYMLSFDRSYLASRVESHGFTEFMRGV